MLPLPMTSAVATAILELAARFEPAGVTMGRIVDALENEGFTAKLVEQELWRLLAERRLTPCGYIGRQVCRRNQRGESKRVRTYELLLIPWSEQLDRQLELQLVEGER